MTEVRSFLGFVSYYRRFIPNFSKVATPLNKLLQNLEGTPSQKKKFKVHWGPEQQEAFETLQGLGGLLPYPTIYSALFINLVRGIRMLMPYPTVQNPQSLLMQTLRPLLFSTQMLVEMDLVLCCIRSKLGIWEGK